MSNSLEVNMRRAELDRASDARRRENLRQAVRDLATKHRGELAAFLDTRVGKRAVYLREQLVAAYDAQHEEEQEES